ncbi:hypothetical protein Tco_0688998 [Tanacetum coccineum]
MVLPATPHGSQNPTGCHKYLILKAKVYLVMKVGCSVKHESNGKLFLNVCKLKALTNPSNIKTEKEESPCLTAKASQIQEQDSHKAESSPSVGLTTAPKMVINSPCLNDKKELAIPEQTATDEELRAAKISNFEVNCRLLAINPTVHLFRAFYHTCWSNGWVSFSKRAGRLQCYTEKLDALRRWREMFFWVDDALVPWNFAFYTQGLLPRDERPPPGSYSIEDAELINENRIPINAYSEAFLCHMGISRNYFQRPEEVPTFIGEDGREMDLFSVVHLSKPKQVTEGVRPLRDGEEPLLESTAGRTMELVLEQPELRGSTECVKHPHLCAVCQNVDSGVEAQCEEGYRGDDWRGPVTKWRAPLSLWFDVQRLRRILGCVPTLAAKERDRETLPPNVEATSDSSAPVTHAAQSPPQTGPKAFDARCGAAESEVFDYGNASQSIQKDEEILLLKKKWSMRRLRQSLREKQEEKLRKLSIEYDEELYPHMLSTIAERRWLISHGLRLAAMSTLESQEVRQSFGDVVKCALVWVNLASMPTRAAEPSLILSKAGVSQLQVPLKESLEARHRGWRRKTGCEGMLVSSWGSLRRLGMRPTKLAGPSKVVVTASRLFFLV